jgi:hypothetical protein
MILRGAGWEAAGPGVWAAAGRVTPASATPSATLETTRNATALVWKTVALNPGFMPGSSSRTVQ